MVRGSLVGVRREKGGGELRPFQLVYKVKIIFIIIQTHFWWVFLCGFFWSLSFSYSGVHSEVSRGYMMCDTATD